VYIIVTWIKIHKKIKEQGRKNMKIIDLIIAFLATPTIVPFIGISLTLAELIKFLFSE